MVNFNDIWLMCVHNFWALVFYFEGLFRLFVSPPRKDVSGKTVLVTGAGSGLGQGLTIEFAKLGATVIGWDISQRGLSATESKLDELNLKSRWFSYVCDLSNREQVYAMAKKVKQDVGEIDILVNNAGIVTGKNFLECDDAMIVKTMEVNAIAHFWTLKSFLPSMIKRNDGHIVSIASGAGLVGVPGLVDYCASKFAAVGIAESLDAELYGMQKNGVHSTVVCPYFIDTGMFDGVHSPFIPLLKTEWVVNAIIDGVLRNKRQIILPVITVLFSVLKWLLPTKTLYELGSGTQVDKAMNTYTGRKNE